MRIALIIILYIFTCLFQGTLVYAHDMESEVFKVAIEDSWPPYADENGEGILLHLADIGLTQQETYGGKERIEIRNKPRRMKEIQKL